MSTEPTGVLGRIVQHAIEEVEFLPAAPQLRRVKATTPEVTALCPVTGQPDIYTVEIEYDPNEVTHDGDSWTYRFSFEPEAERTVKHRAKGIIESKSLKLYLWKFRDRGIACEDLAATIAQELTEQLDARVVVRAIQQPRGGIVLDAQAIGILS